MEYIALHAWKHFLHIENFELESCLYQSAIEHESILLNNFSIVQSWHLRQTWLPLFVCPMKDGIIILLCVVCLLQNVELFWKSRPG